MAETISRVLVTGASGFIGTALCARLIASGVEVHGVSRSPRAGANTRNRSLAAETRLDAQTSKIHWWKADLVELEAARSLTRSIQPDATFHLASLVTGSRDLQMVLPILQNNFMTAFNLLLSTAESRAGRVVLAGSFEEPDELDSVPCSPYAAAKWSASGYARMFRALYKVSVVNAKIFMVYGPGQQDYTKLIPYVITSLLRGEAPKLSSGIRLVDWVYVDDVVDGLIACAQTSGIDGHTVELGSGEMHSVREIVEKLVDLAPSKVEPLFGALPDRPLERIQQADIAVSHELIGWRPSTPLESGLTRTVEWYKKSSNAISN